MNVCDLFREVCHHWTCHIKLGNMNGFLTGKVHTFFLIYLIMNNYIFTLALCYCCMVLCTPCVQASYVLIIGNVYKVMCDNSDHY